METQGAFIVIGFSAENVTKQPTEIPYGDLPIYLQDEQERSFEETVGFYSDACFGKKLNPGIPENCRIVFTVSANSRHLELIFPDTDAIPITD